MTLQCHLEGRALLIRQGPVTEGQRAFAAGLDVASGYTVVIVDLDREHPEREWEPVLRDLSDLPGGLLLVPWSPREGGLLRIGQWLADRLGRTVIALDSHPVAATRGGLFVPPGVGNGWYRMESGRQPVRESRRFPKPRWADAAPLERSVALSEAVTQQPLPGGAWLYAEDTGTPSGDAAVSDHGLWLCANLAWSHDTINVVLGYPGGLPLPVSEVARLWSTLPEQARAAVRFVRYGAAAPSGQELADALGHRVVVRTGVPVSRWRAADPVRVAVLDADGSLGWEPFATEVSYSPGAVAPEGAAAVLPGRLAGLPEVSACVYALSPGVELEAVASGLWIRPGREPAGAAEIRCHAADPRHPVVWVDSAVPGPAEEAAATVLDALSPELRARCHVRPATAAAESPRRGPLPQAAAPPDLPPADDPALDFAGLPSIRLESGPPEEAASFSLPELSSTSLSGLSGADTAEPDPEEPAEKAAEPAPGETAAPEPAKAAAPAPAREPAAPEARLQPVPRPQASALPTERGLEKERLWLQRSLNREFAAAASSVARVLSQSPGLRGAANGTSQEALTDLVAVRLYLGEHGQRIDDAVRTAKVGPHVPFARCVTSGLRRLPSYRGAARLRATLADAEWKWYGNRRLVTEWAFCPAVTDGSIVLPGTVDFLIWSMTARRTSLLESGVASQVLFLPGTSFKVLRVRDGDQPEVLLRELAAGEIAADGHVETGQVPLDDVALAGLGKASDRWARTRQGAELPRQYARRFMNPPGLILGAAEPAPLAGAGAGARGQTGNTGQTGEGGAG